MWKQIFEFAKDIVLLNREIQQNKEDIKEVRQELKEVCGEIRDLRTENQQLREEFAKLIMVAQQLNFDIQEVSQREQSEREKLILKLENEMLKFERRLPSGKDEK